MLAGHLNYIDKSFPITYIHAIVIAAVAAQHYSPPHTLWGCAVGLAAELASALTAATILADAAVTPPSPK